MGQPGIEIGGKKNRARKISSHGLKDHQLVVDVTAQHADRIELDGLSFQCFGQATEIVELTAACGHFFRAWRRFPKFLGRRFLGLTGARLLVIRFGRQLTVETCQIGVSANPAGPGRGG
jgi:diaminopimelate decarboxylase